MTVTPPPQPPPYSGSYTTPHTPGGQPPPKKSSGCGKIALIGCTVILALAIIFVGGLVFFVFGAIKRSDVYTEARNRAAADPRVIATLGEPINTGWWVSGSVHVDNGRGTADITFPIKGPKGEAKVHATASRDTSAWSYSQLTVTPEGGGQIDVLHR
jgi:hypothetical protein